MRGSTRHPEIESGNTKTCSYPAKAMLASQMLDNVALAPLILTILAACYYPAVPRGYQHISDDQHSLQALARLTTVSQIFSFILFVLASASFNLARFYYPVAFGALTWAGLIALAPRLHSVSNIKLASHLTMFLILALNLIATVYVSKDLVMRYRDFDFEKLKYDLAACILLSQFAITLVFTFWVGFWSPGDDTAIEENVL